MNQIFKYLAVSILAISPIGTISQGAPPAATRPAATEPVGKLSGDELQEKVLPDLNLDATPLSDFLDFVRELIPGFQYVIIRDPGIAADFPTLPAMKLKKVTFGQALQIIQEAVPALEYHPVESEKGAVIFLFKIHNNTGDPVPVPASVLKVYRLAETVDALAARNPPPRPPELDGLNHKPGELTPAGQLAAQRVAEGYAIAVKETHKAALNTVLSLLKATLTQAGDTEVNPVIQLHEETETLIVKGTANQVNAVQRALEALTPAATLAPLKEKFGETERRYQSELAAREDEAARRSAELQASRAEIESLHQQLIKLEVAQERLKLQLEAERKKAVPKE